MALPREFLQLAYSLEDGLMSMPRCVLTSSLTWSSMTGESSRNCSFVATYASMSSSYLLIGFGPQGSEIDDEMEDIFCEMNTISSRNINYISFERELPPMAVLSFLFAAPTLGRRVRRGSGRFSDPSRFHSGSRSHE